MPAARMRIARPGSFCSPAMIQPIGGSPPSDQLLNFVGPLTGFHHQDRILFPAGYDPTASTTYPILIVAHGKQSGAAGGAVASSNVVRTRIQANMPSTIRNCIVLFVEAYDHSWYTNNLAADANLRGSGSVPAYTMIWDELLPYVFNRVRWNGRLVLLTFSMGCQFIKFVPLLIPMGLRASMHLAGPRLRYTVGGAWTASGGPPTDDLVFQEVWGPETTAPETNAKYVAGSPETSTINNATMLKAAIAAGTFRWRFGVGASDGTTTGHHLFLTGVLDAQSIPYTSVTDYPGVTHNWAGCMDADGTSGANIFAFLETGLAVAA